MTREELSLLVYFETCVVDHGGLVDMEKMNADDIAIAKRWAKSGFIRYGRVCYRDSKRFGRSQWVVLSGDAIKLAHLERRARILRGLMSRRWKKTGEKEL